MPSPFPGMDPYLEGYLWPDVHSALASKMRQYLAPLLRPRYAARLGIYVVEDTMPEGDVGIMYPDVEVLRASAPDSHTMDAGGVLADTTPATLAIPMILPVDVQIPTIEVRDSASNQLVTSIEILSPVNKREPGLQQYRHKRQRLYQAGVHLIEIDLLRRGVRPLAHPLLPAAAYLIALTRAHSGKTDVWSIGIRDPLPRIPVPLRPPDDDVALDIGAALAAVYDEAAYDLSIDYRQSPPPPAFSEADEGWLRELVGAG